ncbi:hypothetical protein KDA14_05970, partial [Candidatus Saccharibacteria bacterium]|nr:hypothetical protein [Candidatus Saccharibacteria bacterium]
MHTVAEHLRDFVDHKVDTFEEVLSAGEGPHGAQLHAAGRMALRVMGARLLSSTDSTELWRFPFGKDQQAVMRMHQPEVVIPALLRHHDLGVFYTRTGWPSESGRQAGPLWEPEVDQTSVLRGIDTGDAESDATISMVAALAQRSRHLRTAGRFGAWAIGPYRDKKAHKKWQADTGRTKDEIWAHYDIKPDVYTGPTGFLDSQWVQYSSGLLAPHIKPEDATLEDL